MGDGRYYFVYIKVSEVPWESYNTVLKIGVLHRKYLNNLDVLHVLSSYEWRCYILTLPWSINS